MQMELKKKSIVFVSGHDPVSDPGVEKKVSGLCAAAAAVGFTVNRVGEYCNSVSRRKRLLEKVYDLDSKYVVLRSFNSLNLLLLPQLRRLRGQGRVLILDQPTPMSAYSGEVLAGRASVRRKLTDLLLLYLNGPWGQWIFDRIIQYGEESRYFSFGNRKRTVLTGNGIDIGRISLREPSWPSAEDEIRLLGVSSAVRGYVGYDRVIKAMGAWKRSGRKPAVRFDVVGSLPDDRLVGLAQEEGVSGEVRFLGRQDPDTLGRMYGDYSLAVGALAPYRLGLRCSSVLKVREYCLAGIPFMTAGRDPDFPDGVPFRFEVPNDGSIAPILDVFDSFPARRAEFTDESIRKYALGNLSYGKKFTIMTEGL